MPGDGEAIAGAVIAMAHSLRMQVVAEGVEDAEQLELLRAAGCDLGQGYLFSRPLQADQLASWLRRQESSGADAASTGEAASV
jgi:EAL domain-containing protein (putative c-di-GMP-specific phosphodiesterase class I)